ncbi:hypothetical protein HWV62_28172 [Athelia sp. TMB]|nr:hypothetical protein HWV62_28172 [Athelia sp. TMB]
MSSSGSGPRGGRPRIHFLRTVNSTKRAADVALYPSLDGERITRQAQSPTTHRPSKRSRVEPDWGDDEFASWTPGIEKGDEAAPASDQSREEADEAPPSGVVVDLAAVQRRTRYLSSVCIVYILYPAFLILEQKITQDYPMFLWKRDHVTEFVQEFVRHEALGTHRHRAICSTCKEEIPTPPRPNIKPLSPSNDDPSTPPHNAPSPILLMRCRDCFGDCVECSKCCLMRHSRLPLHRTEEWTGIFWQRKTLRSLGLVVQLGHGHDACHHPDAGPEHKGHEMTIIDSHGIHGVTVNFCACERALTCNKRQQLLRAGWYPASVTDPQTCATIPVLEEYHLLNLKGALNVRDFVAAVSRRADAGKVTTPPDREKAMGRMFRQYAFIKRLKRSGRAHDPAGIGATALGGCAVLCWACPQEGINIPSNWEEVDAKYKFLYMLILAMDANFRLVNRLIGNERPDPELGPGWGYVVAPAPYKEHLKSYVSEKDISTCIAFAALLQKDSRATTGLRTSGVGACMCARHEVFRPCGVGDLQKGERYANMDYIFFSAIMGITLLITISYDIVCQWKINLNSRINKLPAELHPDCPDTDAAPFSERVSTGIPVWHAAAHEDKCRVANSLRQIPGVGHTDGEAIERGWSHMNQHASSMKEMGQGNRHDALDDVIGNHNWEKNIAQGDILSRKLIIAEEERDVQLAAFNNARKTVDPEQARVWVEEVTKWEEMRNVDHKWPNPYEIPSEGVITEAQVRLELQRQETEDHHAGQSSNCAATATAFLSLGLHIEHLQRQVTEEASSEVSLTANQKSVLEERRVQILRKLKQLRDAQKIYMPYAHSLVVAEEDNREARDLPRPLAEDTKLWLPSNLSSEQRRSGCDPRLPDMELKLRVAQCEEALNTIRSNLHAKQHLIHRRNKHVTGQRKSTRARALVDRLGDKIQAQYRKYTRAREALLELGGLELYAQKFQVLLKEHLTLDGEELPPDHEASRRMNRAGGGGPRSQKKKKPGDSTKVLSWIWVAGTTIGAGGIHDSVRREFLKARARKHRWVEEVMLLIEEMRRVLRFLNWRADWWRQQEGSWDDMGDDVSDGLHAYAQRQAALCEAIAAQFKAKWEESKVKAIREAVNELEGLEGTILAPGTA